MKRWTQCTTCVYGLTCGHPPDSKRRSECLEDWNYVHYKKGDPRFRLLKLQRSGEINIVIGAEGEHEVNANWTIHEAYAHLANVCNECGGLVTRDGSLQLLLGKTYGPTFVLEWMHGKLYKISIRRHTTWWEQE